jgi:hypothetical protein
MASLTLGVIVVAIPATFLFAVKTGSAFRPRVWTSTSLVHFIEAMDLPAFSIDLLISRLSSAWPGTWTPLGMLVDTWNLVSFPFYSLPFWWFCGVGLDALLKRRHLRWPALLIGTFLWGFFLFIVLGLTFGLPAEDHKGMAWAFYGFGFWIALFSTFPATWVRQILASRKMRVKEL